MEFHKFHYDAIHGKALQWTHIDLAHDKNKPFLDHQIVELYQTANTRSKAFSSSRRCLETDELLPVADYICSDLSLDIEKLKKFFFPPTFGQQNLIEFEKEEASLFLLRIVELIEVVDVHYRRYTDHSNDLWTKIEDNLAWMGYDWREFLGHTINLKLLDFDNEKEICLFRLLVLTSGLEQCLGNLLLIRADHIPPLLKDLLPMLAKEEVIDYCLVHLLMLIVGPPTSVNIRNLIWHGFLEVDFIESKYWHFLLCLTVTIGRQLGKNIFEKIPRRPLHNFNEYEAKIMKECPRLDVSISHIKSYLTCNSAISTRLGIYWNMFIEVANNCHQVVRKLSYCLLLPLLEALFRYLFCLVNNVPVEYLSAMMGKYYVTFEEIFDYELDVSRFFDSPMAPKRINRLYRVFPRELMLAGLDIFLLPEGLRFRDRLGHGQVNFKTINEKATSYVLQFVAEVLQASASKADQQAIKLPRRSLFHGTSIFQTTIVDCLAILTRIEAILPQSNGESVLIAWEMDLDRFQSIERDLMNPTIYRNAECEDLIKEARQMLTNVQQTLENVEAFLTERLAALERRKLRQRQRDNLETLLKICPDLLKALMFVIFFFGRMWTNLESEVYHPNGVEKEPRKHRLMLKWLQNMSRKSQMDKNEWLNVLELANEASEYCLINL